MAVLEGAVIVLLLVLSGFLAMAEIAIVSSRRGRLQHLADAGKPMRAPLWHLRRIQAEYLAAVQMGMTLIAFLPVP